MRICVKLFAGVAQRAGARELSLEVPDGSPASAVLEQLASRFPGLALPAGTMLARNLDYVAPSDILHEGDTLALIPPVSGG